MFNGEGKICEYCLSVTHTTEDCSLALDKDPDLAHRMKAVETAAAFLATSRGMGSQQHRSCLRCKFKKCKYRHVCRHCEGRQQVGDCTSAPRQTSRAGPVTVGPLRRDTQERARLSSVLRTLQTMANYIHYYYEGDTCLFILHCMLTIPYMGLVIDTGLLGNNSYL